LLFFLFSGCIRRNRLTANASDSEIDGVIKDWLWFAEDREGGRKKRELEKEKKQDNAIENENDNDNITMV
jgi:hypothetical protein